MDTIYRMAYSQYKKHYSDCETVYGSYSKSSKSIEVKVPAGRMKPSGVRGERFWTYRVKTVDNSGNPIELVYRATCAQNALKQHIRECEKYGYVAVQEI